jgi:hypothetical protein
MARDFSEIAKLWVETYGDGILQLSYARIVGIANHCIDVGLVAKMDSIQPAEGPYLIADIESALADAAHERAVADAAMPKLTGTEKQIHWAEEIRKNAIEKAYKLCREARRRQDEYLVDRLTAYVDGVLRQKDSARWFIDNRFDFYEFQSITKQKTMGKFESTSVAEAEALSEISIQPKTPKALQLNVALLADGSLALCPRSSDLIRTLNKYHLVLDPSLAGWRKRPPKYEVSEQAAEIAADIVEIGFIAEVCDPDVRRKAQEIIDERQLSVHAAANHDCQYDGVFTKAGIAARSRPFACILPQTTCYLRGKDGTSGLRPCRCSGCSSCRP